MFDLPDAILFPVFGHLALVFFLFVMVSIRRKNAVDAGALVIDSLAYAGAEPELSRRWARNLDNQFQVPMLFYALVALLYATDSITAVQVSLAWLFLAGRIAHTAVQASGDNVTLRGRVFVVNFAALALMWLVFFATRWGVI